MQPEEVVHRLHRLPYQKMKSRINASFLSAEETDVLKDDRIDGSEHTQQVCSTTDFFTMLVHSQDPCILKCTAIVKGMGGDGTRFFEGVGTFLLRDEGCLSVTFNVCFNCRVYRNGRNKKICCGGIQNICHADLICFLAGSYFFSIS